MLNLKNKSKVFLAGLLILALLSAMTLSLVVICAVKVLAPAGNYVDIGEVVFQRETTPEEEEYSEDSDTRCPVMYSTEDGKYTAEIVYTYEEWEYLGDDMDAILRVYEEEGGDSYVVFRLDAEPTDADIAFAAMNFHARENKTTLTAALALLMITVSVGIVVFYGKVFTLYEKFWFLSILVISGIVAVFLPEEDLNGVSGIVIMALYLADTFLNILCELLISKQSKWNFIVSVFVEIVEIAVCLVLAYRFATMAVTLFFWLPCDIISFINWNRKKDTEDESLTKVRTLTGWQEVIIIASIVVWTVVVGYFLSGLDIATELFGGNRTLATVVCYLDACASAVGIMNGLAILFRFREQWIAWYICSILEAIINILAGQYVLLVLKVGYFTNTTYGFIKWSRYIKAHPELKGEKTIL